MYLNYLSIYSIILFYKSYLVICSYLSGKVVSHEELRRNIMLKCEQENIRLSNTGHLIGMSAFIHSFHHIISYLL